MKFTHVFAIAAAGALVSCGQMATPVEEQPPAPPAPVAEAPPPAPQLPCGILAQRDWTAELGSGASPTLTVSGVIDLGTPGFGVSLARDPAEAAGATSTTLTLQLRPPSGMVTQVVTPTNVRYFGPAGGAYQSVNIVCDGAAVTTISVAP
ncbi:MAG: hypothetical protein ABW199_07485 [Caulobacterales bacterium]